MAKSKFKFTDKEKKAIKAAEEHSVRAAQRTLGLVLGKGGKTFTRETLWEGVQDRGLDGYETIVANLTQNMKKDAALFSGNFKSGWKLTKAGVEVAKNVTKGEPAVGRFGGKVTKKVTKKAKTKKKTKTKKKVTKKATKKVTKKTASVAPKKRKRKSKTAQAAAAAKAPAPTPATASA